MIVSSLAQQRLYYLADQGPVSYSDQYPMGKFIVHTFSFPTPLDVTFIDVFAVFGNANSHRGIRTRYGCGRPTNIQNFQNRVTLVVLTLSQLSATLLGWFVTMPTAGLRQNELFTQYNFALAECIYF